MSAVGLIVHLGRESAAVQARELADWLQGEGHDVRVPDGDAELAGLTGLAVPETSAFAEGLDLVVTLGGDGSILRAVELIGTASTPILGVDHGQLGYLTEVQPGEAAAAVARFLVGDHSIDERMLLDVTIEPAGGERSQHFIVLNEVVVERSGEVNTIRLRVDIDGEFFTTYTADGLILATPTGSTAYAFSVRGPIIAPTHRAMLLTPVSPHMLFDRSLVLSPNEVVEIEVAGHRRADVAVDGQPCSVLEPGDVVRCSPSAATANFVRFGAYRYHQILKSKFGLPDR